MKKLIFFIFLLFQICQLAYTQDIELYKYLPLRVGNVWLYNNSGMPFSGKTRMKVIDSVNVNGKIFYTISIQYIVPNANCQHSPFHSSISYVRIDSVTGRVTTYTPSAGCSWSVNEKMIDSLKSRRNDSSTYLCTSRYKCTDTSNSTIFGLVKKSKKFFWGGVQMYTEYKYRIYVKDFGITQTASGINGAVDCYGFLTGCVINGILYGDTTSYVGNANIKNEIPEFYKLHQNYPNPFNPVTNIKYHLPKNSDVKLIVYDITGKEMEVLVNDKQNAGIYDVEWNAGNYSSGVYFYKIAAGDYIESKKMVLIK